MVVTLRSLDQFSGPGTPALVGAGLGAMPLACSTPEA